MSDWRPITEAIEAAKDNDGWIPKSLFGKWIHLPSGDHFITWVGQCDAGDIWLVCWCEDEACEVCSDCDKPDWFMPLPAPPERGWMPMDRRNERGGMR